MVVLSQPSHLDENLSGFETCTVSDSVVYAEIPTVDLSDTNNSKKLIVKACKELGFFKVINHGVSIELVNRFEAEASKFFKSAQEEKDALGPPKPFGYGNKSIGLNGDVGWVEYLLLPDAAADHNPGLLLSKTLWCVAQEYLVEVKKMTCRVLDMTSDGLGIEPRDVLSKLIRDEKSDSLLRVNHYPACGAGAVRGLCGRNLIGFGAHTDPQIISALRSSNTSGLQICQRDGSWAYVPPDHTSFFINVGDSLEVMTNGRFRSVKHRVLADGVKPRLSMIYFGGPPTHHRIVPLTSLMVEEGEESLYEEFTWSDYKKSATGTRLGDNRLSAFSKKTIN